MESKLPTIKAKVITKLHGDQKDNKNAYVLLKSEEHAQKAAEKLNQAVLNGKHLRVDIDQKDEGAKSANDFETTVFIGNLPFIVNEEEVRSHIASGYKGKPDPIKNVRLVRDPQTFVGKGIGYVQFADKESMRFCIEELNNSRFQGRPLRIKKAVEPKRLEKKKRRTQERAELRQQSKEEDDDIARLRNFEKAAYGDSSSKVPGISQDSKTIKKEKKKASMEAHFDKIKS